MRNPKEFFLNVMAYISKPAQTTIRISLILGAGFAITTTTFAQQDEGEETAVEKQTLKERTHVQPVAAALEQLLPRLEKVAEILMAKVESGEIVLDDQQLQTLEDILDETPGDPPPGGPTSPPPFGGGAPGTPPGTDYAYNIATDTLTLPVTISQNSLVGSAISEAKLMEEGVDETTAMAIPILRDVIKDPTKTTDGSYFNAALADVTSIAGEILTDVTIDGFIPPDKVWSASTLKNRLGDNPYTYELAKLLAEKGAIGEKSASGPYPDIENLADDIISLVGGRGKLNDVDSLDDLIGGEVSEAGTGINTHLLGSRKFTINDQDADLFNVKIENVKAVLGSDVTIQGGDTDVKYYLTPAADSGDRKIFAIGATKDLTIKDSVTFKNDNHVEDHALAIGAADDVHFRSGSLNDYLDEAFMAQYLDGNDPVYTSEQDIQPTTHPADLDLTYEGSNLGLGSYDTLELVNVNVSTGGNLALGTLKELHILSTNPNEPSRITVGQYSDSDNAYLYAQERIAINGLEFGGRVNEIYMESITIDLKNVAFPSNSEVMLRSQDGRATFGSGNRALGAVNFIDNVSHGGTTLDSDHFSGPDGHVNSSITVNDGVPAVRVRAFSSANK